MVRRRSTVRFRNVTPAQVPLFEKNPNRFRVLVGTNGCPQEAPAARQRQSRQAMPAAPGMPGAAPSDPGHGGEGAGDACAGIMPTARRPGKGAGQSSGAWPCIVSRPAPVAGIGWDMVRAPAADAGRRQARAARHLARVPVRRLMPAPETARGKSADRPERQAVPSRHRRRSRRPGAHSCMLSGPDTPVLCARRSRAAALRGTDLP
jgi:hypothetical protein